jgi:hypothetical protein
MRQSVFLDLENDELWFRNTWGECQIMGWTALGKSSGISFLLRLGGLWCDLPNSSLPENLGCVGCWSGWRFHL